MWSVRAFLISGSVSVKAETARSFQLHCKLVLQRSHTSSILILTVQQLYLHENKGRPGKIIQYSDSGVSVY